jgi:endonuclease/exonuclease/phosphatase family metal-dependent hydrolase
MSRVLPLVLLPALLLACKDKGGDTGGGEAIAVATYNAGFALGFVRATEERLPVTAAAIAALDADVVCLQEVWLPEHVSAVADAAASAFPHQYFPAAQQEEGDAPACAADTYVFECARAECGDVCADDLVDCVLDSCGFALLGLDDTCQNCVMANVGGTIDEVEEACLTGDQHYAFGGSFGTGILSKHPLGETEELVFESTLNRRSALHTTVEAPGGALDLYCTHLTAVFGPSIPYPRPSGSWAEEQLLQFDTLLAWLDSSATTGRVALLGDLNAGPATDDAVAVEPDSWAKVEATDLSNPYAELDGRCTFCPENPICSAFPDGDGELLDHVLLRGLQADSATRVLDADISTESCGASIDAAYSDHYGVAAVVR